MFFRLRFATLMLSTCLHLSAQPPTLYKKTDHFEILCAPQDQTIAEEILVQNEAFFARLSQDFNHTPSTPFIVTIHPTLVSLHEALGWPDAPNWVIARTKEGTDTRVCPNAPDTTFTRERLMHSYKMGLTTLFLYSKFSTATELPRWLQQGIALYKANWFTAQQCNKELGKDMAKLPDIEQLETNGAIDFACKNGFKVSFSLVDFLVTRWGWDSALTLLGNYNNFEKIVKLGKQEFKTEWIKYISQSNSLKN
ncbi:hypothetical protein K2W90_02560 [Candidatus Babeliales bacterium]|nr:hypothetical protein [Candidatus Babeliales bacterium]